MSVFKEEQETKRVIFNIRLDLAERLEICRKNARRINKKLNVEDDINKSLEKYLKKAEKKIDEIMKKRGMTPETVMESSDQPTTENDPDDSDSDA